MGINPINAFETDDGMIFKDRFKAIKYSNELDFDKWYTKNGLHVFNFGSAFVIEAPHLKEWLKQNSEIIYKFLDNSLSEDPNKKGE